MPVPNQVHFHLQTRRQGTKNQPAFRRGVDQIVQRQKDAQTFPREQGAVVGKAERAFQTEALNCSFDAADSEEQRYEMKKALNAQRIADYKSGEYKLGGGVVDPLPEDAPFFVKDYYDYYKTPRGYHKRSLNSNGGWNVIGCMSFVNQPILQYSNEIRSAVLIVHGEKAYSCYFGKDAYADMTRDSKYTDNKELLLIPDAVHTDLYDGGANKVIPFDKLESFFAAYLK